MPTKTKHATVSTKQYFMRPREVAHALGVSESQARSWMRDGTVPSVRLPGIRAVRAPSAGVEQLASEWSKP